jgi:hypothetical protein
MTHIRTRLRNRFRDALQLGLGAEYDVYASRKTKRNHTPGVTLVDMRFLNDQTREEETMSDDRIHIASLYIRIQRSGDEDTIDDDLDEDELRVTSIVRNIDWSDILEEQPEQMQANFADDADAGLILGAIVLRYDLEYRIDIDDPTTTIE